LKCKKNAGPVAVTVETERASSGALSSKVGTKFAFNGVSFDKVQLKADGGQILESSFKPCAGCKVSFKGSKGADLGVDYVKGGLYTTAKIDVKDISKLSATACMNAGSGFTIGAAAGFNLTDKTVASKTIGGAKDFGPLSLSATYSSALTVGALYRANDNIILASTTTHSPKELIASFAVGGSYKAPVGTFKAKVSNGGNITGCMVREIAPKVTLTATGAISNCDPGTFKYGLGLVM
jgi:voltage-dependent anion channel protein 2